LQKFIDFSNDYQKHSVNVSDAIAFQAEALLNMLKAQAFMFIKSQ